MPAAYTVSDRGMLSERGGEHPDPIRSLATALPRAIKHNAVQWLLLCLIAAASSLDGRCRLRGDGSRPVSHQGDEDRAALVEDAFHPDSRTPPCNTLSCPYRQPPGRSAKAARRAQWYASHKIRYCMERRLTDRANQRAGGSLGEGGQ